MNYKKSILATAIVGIIFSTVQATDYKIIVSQEKNDYDIIENSFPVATEWVDTGSEFNCLKEFSAYDYPLGESFTQNENCIQKQERTVTTTEIFNGTPRTTVKVENQNIPVVISYLDTGKENFNTGTQRTEYSNWLDDGIHYACAEFNPLVSTVNLGESFNQNRSCSQKQNRNEIIYDIWADGSEILFSTNIKNRTLTELEYQQAIGTKNFTTGTQRTEYTNWLDDGSHYACSDFYPLSSSVNLDESFVQERDCLQDQERTQTVYDIWADGSETVSITNIEQQSLTESETQNSLGTKNFTTGSQRTEYTNWLDNGIHYDCGIFTPLVSTVNLSESFTQNRSCSQNQNRNEIIYDIWADGSETINVTTIETQTLIENESQNAIGTKNFNTGSQRTEYTNWLDTDGHYNCNTFTPLNSSVNLGESFTQNRNCLQDQDRTKTVYDIWANGSETVASTNLETQTLNENETQNSTGTKNYDTGTTRTNSTDWLNIGALYACNSFSPLSSTIKSPLPLTQSRICSQDRERTTTIYNIWADGSETIKTETLEQKAMIIHDVQDVTGTGQAASCKAILNAGWSTGDGIYEINIPSGDHNVICDMTTDGGGWTRWWWYNGNGTFPSESDVLGYNFGEANVNSSYGFQTLPSNVSQASTELLAIDGENTILKWDFANGGATATSVWNAFTIRTITLQGAVLNNTPWNPSVIQGAATTTAQDSFMYREQSGVKSFILDDDGCDCATTLSAGASMCGASWNIAYGGEMAYGVDNLKDLNCESTQPDKSMSMFYREK